MISSIHLSVMRIQSKRFPLALRNTLNTKTAVSLPFFMRLGRSISFPCALRSFGERAWWSISQHRFRADDLQTNTMPRTSRVHPAHIVEGVDLQSGMMQRAYHFICVPPFWPYTWKAVSLGRTGTHDSIKTYPTSSQQLTKTLWRYSQISRTLVSSKLARFSFSISKRATRMYTRVCSPCHGGWDY